MDKHKKFTDDVIMKTLLKELRYSALQFSKELGYRSHNTIHHIIHGRNYISEELANKIVLKFPEVSFSYIKKGELPVLLSPKLSQNQSNILSFELPKKGEINNERVIDLLESIDDTLKKLLEISLKQ